MPTSATHPDPHEPYEQALQRLLELADYERIAGTAAPAVKYDLGRMRELAWRMGDPQTNAPVVHIAGTKGKGSVAAMVTSILRAAKYRVGTFTSPHLHTFRERIRLDTEPADEVTFAAAVEKVWPHIEAMADGSPEGRPTTFEALTAMAFHVFQSEAVDVQVIEVGLGGRLDSTNIVDSSVAVITPLSLDHTAILGDTIEAIASEKAGIIKGPAPVIVSPQSADAMPVLWEAAERAGTNVVDVAREVTILDKSNRQTGSIDDLTAQRFTVATAWHNYDVVLPLLGAHQRENAATAIAAVEALHWAINPTAVERGLANVRWDGRFQVLRPAQGESEQRPFVVTDVAHNPHSMLRLCEAVGDHINPLRTLAVFGCSGDKAVEKMVQVLAGIVSEAFVCASRHPRSADTAYVASLFEAVQVPVTAVSNVEEAVRLAVAEAGPQDLVLITGSMFVVAEALESWYGIPGERYAELDSRPSPII